MENQYDLRKHPPGNYINKTLVFTVGTLTSRRETKGHLTGKDLYTKQERIPSLNTKTFQNENFMM